MEKKNFFRLQEYNKDLLDYQQSDREESAEGDMLLLTTLISLVVDSLN